MGFLEDWADYLASGGIGAVGGSADWAIFKSRLPASPDKAVALSETGGLPSVKAMSTGPGQAVLRRPRMQVLVRSTPTGYSTGREKANAAFNLLDGFLERAINGTTYKWAEAVQDVFLLEYDENNRPVFAFNVEVHF